MRVLRAVLAALLTSVAVQAQPGLAGAAEIQLALERLNTLGSVLMIAAHPDDENTELLAYFARGRNLRTGYLSLTRGEGGQNLIGPEQGVLLGLIRTQELLAARRIDGAEQFFTRAIDFGFSKTADETLRKWGREEVLSDVVWVIRKFRPDVIVLRFSGTPRDGHGHHQASAILGKEAFLAAADKTRFPEQLKYVQPWRAKRVVWNTFSFNREQEREAERIPNRLTVDTGTFNPVLGYSYTEIAGMSRSMHRSQGMGSGERRGSRKQFLAHVAGDPARTDLFDGIPLAWDRLPGGAEAGAILSLAAQTLVPERPGETIPHLLKARPLIAAMPGDLAALKLRELDRAISLCAGIWLDASAATYAVTPGSDLKISLTAVNRLGLPAAIERVSLHPARGRDGGNGEPSAAAHATSLPSNSPEVLGLSWTVPAGKGWSQPYWLESPPEDALYTVPDQQLRGLAETPPVLRAGIDLKIDSQPVSVSRPVWRRYVDRIRGELTRPLEVVPPVAVSFSESAVIFPDQRPRPLVVEVQSNIQELSGLVRLEIPAGWRVEPQFQPFELPQAGQRKSLAFQVTPPSAGSQVRVRAIAAVDGEDISSGVHVINYPHIPPQTMFPAAAVNLVRAGIRNLAQTVGYVMGAGDKVPESLRQIGAEVTLLDDDTLARGDLGRFDAIVTGVRAYNVRPDLRANQQRLLEYVRNGGTLVVQYNVLEGGFSGGNPSLLDHIGPYPIKIGRDRVTVEEAPIEFPHSDHPLLQSPNRITSEDFEDWVQERGLYFASGWDKRYESLFSSNDPGESPLPGGILYTRYGKGAYIFSAYSWFRQLPAGVPGAYRIFANLLSAGKAK